jgi:hypothetical protein
MVKTVNLTILDRRWGRSVPKPNPFQPAPGASPPVLVGRESEEAFIDEAVSRAARRSAPTPLAILGLRGLGKTALLNTLAHRVRDDAVHLALEVQHGVPLALTLTSALQQLEKRLRPLSRRLGKAVEDALAVVPMPSFELPHDLGELTLKAPRSKDESTVDAPVEQAIEALNDAVHKHRRFLAVTIDEVHNADPASLRSVVSAVHRSASSMTPILLACAGLPQTYTLLEKMPTYVKRWDISELTFLTRSEAIVGIREPAEQLGVAVGDDVVDLIVGEAGGYPYFLQKYASAAWRHAGERTWTMSDELRTTVDATRASLERTYYANALMPLPLRERVLLVGLAELGAGPHQLAELADHLGIPSAAAMGSTRARLIKKEILFVPYPGAVQFRIPLTDRYILNHKDELLPRIE